ncbi:MAG: glycosyltransferase, partial [Bacteroidota bacterium]|nr:glycosyltransferase [Bacteroidota bacterium]
MQKSNICFFNTTKTWGGGEKWHSEMALKLHSKGYNVLVVTQHSSALFKKVDAQGVRSISVKLTNFSFVNPVRILQLVKLFKKNSVDTLVLNLPNDLKAAGLAARIAGVKHIIYRRGSAIAVRNNFVNRFYYGKVIHSVLANSRATAEKILEKNPDLISKNKIHIVYNGLDIKAFDSIEAKPQRFGDENDIIIGNVGRLVKQKAQEYFIDLAVILKKENIAFKIVIGGEGERKQQLQEYAKAKNVEDKIIWQGFVD